MPDGERLTSRCDSCCTVRSDLSAEGWQTYEQLHLRWLRPAGTRFAMFMQSGQHDGPPSTCDLAAMKNRFQADACRWLTEPTLIAHSAGMHELACILTRNGNGT